MSKLSDELGDILMDFNTWCLCGTDECVLSENYKAAKQAILNLIEREKQQIEDFYRNKIPEKREVNVEQPELLKGFGGESAPYFCSACQMSEIQIMENVEGDRFYCGCSYWKSPHNAYLDKYSQDELWLGWKDKKVAQDYLESLPTEDGGWNDCVDYITAQFNSRGNNDEQVY